MARAISVILVLLIGLADYASGIRVSLSVFYFVPVALAVAWLGWRNGVGIAILSVLVRVLGDYLAIGEHLLPLWSWWNSLAALVTYLVMVWILAAFVGLHRELEQRVRERTMALQEAAQARRKLESELLQVGSRERNSIGHELHDDICQHLVGTALAAKVLAQRLTEQDKASARDAQSIVTWIEEGATKTRQLAQGLLLAAIEPGKLAEKLAELAAEGTASSCIPCRFRHEGEILVSDAGTAAQLFRIAQEATRNALRHGQARHVDLSLVGDAHAICLMVEDDGRGLPLAEERGSGMGLRIMSHRAAYIGGTLSIVPTSGQGTRVICHLPRLPSNP